MHYQNAIYFLSAIKLPILPKRNPSEDKMKRKPSDDPINTEERGLLSMI
jgi:hypothetical protein